MTDIQDAIQAPQHPDEMQVHRRDHLATIETPGDTSIDRLLTVAVERGASVDTLERLMAIRREMMVERAKRDFDMALSAFQSECPIIEKGREVMSKGTVRFKYASLDDIVYAVRDLLKKHGFSYTSDSIVEGNLVTATVRARHESGHSETSSFKVPLDKDAYMSEPQKAAAALSFAQRYAFRNAFGIMTGDDDESRITPKPSPQSPSNPGAPKVAPRDERPKARPSIADKINGMMAKWKSTIAKNGEDTKEDFALWAQEKLRTDHDMTLITSWTIDAIEVISREVGP